MNKKVMIGTFVCGLGILNVAQAQTSDVYVDLSVLDELSSSAASGISSHPLFPVVTTSEKATSSLAKYEPVKKKTRKITPKKKVQKAKVRKQPTAQAEVVAPQAEVPVKEVLQEPVISAPVVPNSAEPVAIIPAIRPITEDEHIVVVDVEPVTPKAQPVVNSEPQENVVSAVEEQQPQEEAEVEAVQKVSASNILLFDDEVSELTDIQRQQIDNIISTFENPQQNKIAILAYNLNNGVDTFKRKRQSLNRAVDVRSYLLPKGYKNFSIKVINIDDSSDKINTVEILEIK